MGKARPKASDYESTDAAADFTRFEAAMKVLVNAPKEEDKKGNKKASEQKPKQAE